MKALVATAVFGLLPVPPMDDEAKRGSGRASHPIPRQLDRAFREAKLPALFLERMATKAELERLREQIGANSAD
jgi:hypothetical protein